MINCELFFFRSQRFAGNLQVLRLAAVFDSRRENMLAVPIVVHYSEAAGHQMDASLRSVSSIVCLILQ
jgi:hypothetical protein